VDTLIAVLPTHVVDQIAAGEVIERPSSVVKELVDNAVDAGARTISIDTQAGGRSLIRVVDDGAGMSPRDAVLAFERHATSKLRAVDDLWSLATMGFRGEALPSIASIARVTLTTRRPADLGATRVQIEGGKLVSVTEVGAAVGTAVEVRDLLYNVPARLKFLRGEATEASHITDFIGKVALAYPQLHLRLRHGGRSILDTPPDHDGFARVAAVLGPRVAARMVAVSGQESGFRVSAYLATPDLAQTTARGVQLFVGRRPVRDRNLLHAVAMGYGELVPRGRYPLAIIFLDAPAGSVDFNVHPQKQEVRFADAPSVAAAVRHTVQTGVARAAWRDELGHGGPVMMIASVAPPRLPLDARPTQLAAQYARDLRELRARPQSSLAFDGDGAPPVPADSRARTWAKQIKDRVREARAQESAELARTNDALRAHAELRTRDVHVEQLQRAEHDTIARQALLELEQLRATMTGTDVSPAHTGAFDARTASDDAVSPRDGVSPDDGVPWDEARLAEGSAPSAGTGLFASLRYLGQLDLTYLVCEADRELVLIDQHVAHERVELARLRTQHETRAIPTQRLLFPTTVEVAPALCDVAARMSGILAQVGYEAEPFGKTSLAIKAVPGTLRHGDPAHVLKKLLGAWADDGAPTEAERLDRVFAEIACHSVTRAGDRLSATEAEALLRAMDTADFHGPGPHNRPVMLRLSLADIARRFGR
jgi:DNA mismatch repair protein MutL